MGHFATYSSVEDGRRTALRLADDGRATLLITARYGEVVDSIDGRVDQLTAADIVADALMLAPELPNGGGDLTLGVGVGEGQPELRSLDRSQMPVEAMSLERRMRDVATELRSRRPLPDPVDSGPRTSGRQMSGSDLMLWAAAFFGAHLVVGFIALVAIGMFVKAMSLWGLLIGLPFAIGLIGVTYFAVGRAFGQRFADAGDVWKPAAVAVVLPSLIGALAGGGFVGVGLAWIYPMIARWGARNATYGGER